MTTVKVKKPELLVKLITNRKKHLALFTEAQKGYRKRVIAKLAKNLKQAQRGGDLVTSFTMSIPQDHTDDYDCAIAMVKMSVDDVLELREDEFKSYVLDEWEWARGALLSNSAYVSKKYLAR